jgi:hypothetical protein
MRILMYLIFAAAVLAAYVSTGPDMHFAPSVVKFLPDLLSVLCLLYVVVVGARQKFRYVSVKYWLIFGSLAFIMFCGPLVNHEGVGPIINGMRYYLRAIPLFFLPAVVDFSDRDLQNYLRFLLGLSLLQLPISVYQRLTAEAIGITTGDVVVGTLMESGILSLFVIGAMCLMAALMLRRRMSKLWFSVCFVLLLIPISINETKVTVILLPLGLLATFILAAPRGRRTLVTLQALAFMIIAAAIFVPLYDYFNKGVAGQFSIEDFFTNSAEVNKYMDREAKVGTGQEAGRMDSLQVPFKAYARDPVKMIFGLGIGNASKSSLGSQFSGQYVSLYWNFVQAESISGFLLELGLLGTSLVLLLHWMVLRDGIYVAKHDDGLVGVLALGYVGAWITVTLGLFYGAIHIYESLAFMFWFFSGLFAARRRQLAVSRTRAKPPLPVELAAMKLKAGSAV